MAGGLIQVISYGNQDLMLTGNPEITFFNIIYRRYTNFGKRTIELNFDNLVNFGETSILTIPKNSGDLLNRLILKIKLPKLDMTGLNRELLDKGIISSATSFSTYILYYDFFVEFYNNLLNIVNIFFAKNDNQFTQTYIKDLNTFIQSRINNDKYEQFYTVVNFFFNNGLVSETNVVNVEIFTNASLYKKISSNLVYIYENFKETEILYTEFKNLILENMKILTNLNKILYTKLRDYIFNTNLIKIGWINKIGIFLINSIDFYIGSNIITKLSDYYINNYGELWYKNPQVYDKIIGNQNELNLFSLTKEETYLYVPIPLWFNGNYGLSFPLIAVQFNSVQVRINVKKFIECIKIDISDEIRTDKLENSVFEYLVNNELDILKSSLEVTMLAEYSYLDKIERQKFAQTAHEYLITQVQEIEFDDLTLSNYAFELDFFHCCKDMYWFAIKQRDIKDIFNNSLNAYGYRIAKELAALNTEQNTFLNYLNVLFNPRIEFNPEFFVIGRAIFNNNILIGNFYEYAAKNILIDYTNLESEYKIILESYLYLNSTLLIGENSNFFNYAVPYNYYNSSPQSGLYSYSFSLKPTESQPAGSINLSRIPSFSLKVKLNPIINLQSITSNSNVKVNTTSRLLNSQVLSSNEYKLVVQTTNYNVLRFIGGIAATAYTY